MDDEIKINLNMADLHFPLTIKRNTEENVRLAAKQVNMGLNAYRQRFKTLSKEHLLVMVAFHFAKENLELKERNDTEPYMEYIQKMMEVIDDHLRNDK